MSIFSTRLSPPVSPAVDPVSTALQEPVRPPLAAMSDARWAWLHREVIPHEVALRRWLRGQLPHDLEVDDVVQDTYAALLAIADVDHIEAPRAYMFRTARSVVRSHWRHAQVVSFEPLEVGPAAD